MKRNLLGQHFLISRGPVRLMVAAAKKEAAVDVVLEVGPGKGALTKPLILTFPEVVAVEKDRRLAEELKKNLEIEKIKNCKIVVGDVLKIDIAKFIGAKRYAVIANIPYYLTSHLIRTLLEAERQPSYMILMVQKEVAERVVAKPPDMNLLALSVQAYGQAKIIGRVSRKEFRPQPEVDSAIIKISGVSKDFFTKHKISEKEFFGLLRTAFSQKRKRLVNSLSGFYGDKKTAGEKIKKAGLLPNVRAQELSFNDWVMLLKTN